MSARRLMLGAVCLGLGVLAHAGLSWHLARAAVPPADLAAAIETFPHTLRGSDGDVWTGRETPESQPFRAKPPYPIDGLVWRSYQGRRDRVGINLFLVYSREGEDRNHHPEICIREVGGAKEDLSARSLVYLGGDRVRPVQRFRFVTGAVRPITVYYWHYALVSPAPPGSSLLQKIHAVASRPVASLTAQVTIVGNEIDQQDAENRFLVTVDAVLRRDFLPATSRMACNRKPVILLGS